MSDNEKLEQQKVNATIVETVTSGENQATDSEKAASHNLTDTAQKASSTVLQPSGSESQPQIVSLAAESWRPDSQLLVSIVALGFSEICAEKALFYTGNASADAAVGWILDNPAAEHDSTPLCFEGELSSSSSDSVESPVDGEMFKMAFAVNSSLKMGLGKIAAQVGHATLGLYTKLCSNPTFQVPLAEWRQTGETKIVLRAQDSDQLCDLQKLARSMGLATYLVRDAGRTQIAAGSITVLSIFGETPKVDQVVGQLKLL